LYLLIFCLPFAKAGVGIFSVVAIASWAAKKIADFRTGGLKDVILVTPLNKALVVFVILNAVSVLFSVDIALSLRAFFTKTLKFVLIFFIVAETINTEKRVKRFLWVLISSAVLMVVDAGVQYFNGVDFLKGYGGCRLSASFSAPNGFGGWLVLVLPALWGASVEKRWKVLGREMKIGLNILLVLLLACLMLTYTRGAWIGLLVSSVLVAYFFFKEKSLTCKRVSALVFVGICGLFLFIWPSLKDQKVSFFGFPNSIGAETVVERLTLSRGFSVRKNLWTESLEIIQDFPLFGCGLNTYSLTAPYYKVAEGGGIYSHNSYLQMAAEIGLLGLGAFLWIVFCFFTMGFYYFNKEKDYLALGLLSGLLAFLVHAFFDNHLYALQLVVLFWLVLGFGTAVMKIRASESKPG